MGYPSLLYLTKPSKMPMELSVFEDLQLLNFIPRAVAKAVRIPCEKDNLLPRQALFVALEIASAKAAMSTLYELSEELYRLDEAYEAARTDAERDLIFLFLLDAEARFAVQASEANFGDPLTVRFASAFAAEVASLRHKQMRSVLETLLPEADAVLTSAVYLHADKVRIGCEDKSTFLSAIGCCAETLGVEMPKMKRPEPRKLCPDMTEGMAKLRPVLMKKLSQFRSEFKDLYQSSVTYYRKELRFYLTMLSFFDRIREAGIPLTYPTICEGRRIAVTEAYDVSLLAKNETSIVPNDISFTEEEPFFFLTGANGGGKTTYLRTVGIATVLCLLGCPVPCVRAEFGEISTVFTHFPRDERFDGSGRFVEENNRVQAILRAMDDRSLVLLNETYSTTNEENAVRMTETLANELFGKRIFGLYITHQHSLAESEIPYLNVLIDRDDSNRRTFKIARQKSTGGSFAKDILERCGLTREALEKRFGSLTEEGGSR